MTRLQSSVLTLLSTLVVVIGCPLAVVLIEVLAPLMVNNGLWAFSAALGLVSAPFTYLMFRRMH